MMGCGGGKPSKGRLFVWGSDINLKFAQYVADLKKWLGDIKPRKVIVDPSATALIVELKQNGFTVLAADNEVGRVISDVSVMLNTDRLLFLSVCKRTIREFGAYVWDAKAAEHGEERPVKTNDHAMDAVRYFVRSMRLVKPVEEYRSPFEARR